MRPQKQSNPNAIRINVRALSAIAGILSVGIYVYCLIGLEMNADKSETPVSLLHGYPLPHTLRSSSHGGDASASYAAFEVLSNQNQCGMPWTEYYKQLKPPAYENELFMWTVSGGAEYRDASDMLLSKWKTLGIHPVLLIALDKETADAVCASGYPSVFWDVEKASYSKVADSKFMIGAELAERQHTGFFIELDVFCIDNPIQHFVTKLRNGADLVLIGHGDVSYLPNIGVWLAKPSMAPFFRLVTKVLAFSLDTGEMYSNHNKRKKKWFDQDVFNDCRERQVDTEINKIRGSASRVQYFLVTDEERQTDLMDLCNFTTPTPTFDLLEHTIISAHDPPTVYDTTICIHPLMPVPFVPLTYKFAAAKFLGFDAEVHAEDERLLKLFNGDYTMNECYDRSWFNDQLDLPHFQESIKYHITAMAVLAVESDRVLVLPRYLRDKDAWGVPLMAAVDVGTLPGKWRFMTIEESIDIDDDEMQVITLQKQDENMIPSVLTKIKDAGARVVAIQNFCMIPNRIPEEAITKQMEEMRFCVQQPGFLKFVPGIGGWNKMCFLDQCKINPHTCQ